MKNNQIIKEEEKPATKEQVSHPTH